MKKNSYVLMWLGIFFIFVGFISFANGLDSITVDLYKDTLVTFEDHKGQEIEGFNRVQLAHQQELQYSGHLDQFNKKLRDIKKGYVSMVEGHVHIVKIESSIITALLLFFALACFISAWGFFKRQPWGRIAAKCTILLGGVVFANVLSPIYFAPIESQYICNSLIKLDQIYPVTGNLSFCAGDSFIRNLFVGFPYAFVNLIFLIFIIGMLLLLSSREVREQFDEEGKAGENKNNPYALIVAWVLVTIFFLGPPLYVFFWAMMGNTHLQKGNFNQAISDFTKTIGFDPYIAVAYYNRGLAYEKQGNFDQAVADYTKAIEINPHLATAYNNRGLVYYRNKKLVQAVMDYTRAIEIKPTFAIAYNNRALAYWGLHDYDKSWADLHKTEGLGYSVSPYFLSSLIKASGKDR